MSQPLPDDSPDPALSPMNNAELVQAAVVAVREAMGRNARYEWLVVVILVLAAGAGIFLLIVGARAQDWTLAVPGVACQGLITLSIRELNKLRRENIALRILPNMLALVKDDAARKRVAVKAIERIVSRI